MLFYTEKQMIREKAMKGIYTCPYCMRTYTVAEEGDYLCECGRQFFYPPMGSARSLKYSCAEPVYLDSSSGSIRKKVRYNYGRLTRSRSKTRKCCPLARVSLISGIIGLLSFGILSIPALVLGFSAMNLISNPFYDYKGRWMAVSGILLGLVGATGWGLWAYSQLQP
jgi:hypothetical protein